MARKIGQIICISLLVLFAASWAASYFPVGYIPQCQDQIWLTRGCLDWLHPSQSLQQLWSAMETILPARYGIRFGEFDGLATDWIPQYFYQNYSTGMTRYTISLWIPTLLMGIVCYFVVWRRRPRAGCCENCNYILTGNVSGRCPECGTLT